MNFALSPTQSPRRITTISAILVAHVLALSAFLATPSHYVKPAPKETVLLMVQTMKPTPPSRPPAPAEKVSNASNQTPAVVVPVIKTETKDSIQVNPANVVAPEPTPSIANAAPTPAPTPAKVENHGPKVVSAVEYLQAPQADYPAIAKRMGEEGRVVMQVLVNDKGRAEKVEIIKSSGFNRLDESARTALMRAIFKPYVEDGKTMTVLATASINFSLRG